MKANCKLYCSRRIRLGASLSLIFFVFLLTGCRQKGPESLSLQWSDNQATGIRIPKALLANSREQNPGTALQVRLQNSAVPMLGEYHVSEEAVFFTPLLPLSPGKHYEVFYNKDLMGRLVVPVPGQGNAPVLMAVYPSADTLPENLLKLYLRFSSPMRAGEALQHIQLLNERGDTARDVFLDLQPELWNSEGTTLTLWLDPGRIKRDLIPHRRLGNPLQYGKRYQLVVDSAWKDVRGLAMEQGYTKQFIAGERDQTAPRPDAWTLEVPKGRSAAPLRINLNEPLDYFLLQEAIQVINKEGRLMKTEVRVGAGEKRIEVFPENKWTAGWYRLRIASHLEDLAGNSLNRLFDRDVTAPQKKEQEFREIAFAIR